MQRSGPGPHTYYVTVFDFDGNSATAVAVSNINGDFSDLRVQAMEVTQGIQQRAYPSTQSTVVRERTAVCIWSPARRRSFRVFANLVPNPCTASAYPANVRLLWKFEGEPDFDGHDPLYAEGGTTNLVQAEGVSIDQRADSKTSFVFTLPAFEPERDALGFEHDTVVDLRTSLHWWGTAPRECTGCLANNTMTLTGVRFRPSPDRLIRPVELIWTDDAGNVRRPQRTPRQVLGIYEKLTPIDRAAITPYRATIDVTSDINAVRQGRPLDALLGTDDEKRLMDRLMDRVTGAQADDFWAGGGPLNFLEPEYEPGFVGVVAGLEPFRKWEAPKMFCCAPLLAFGIPVRPVWKGITVIDEDDDRISTIAHEQMHQDGFFHAAPACGVDGGCVVSWPPDQRGQIQGIGIDTAGTLGRYTVFAPGASGGPAEVVDLMSYCNAPRWISVRNWEAYGTFSPISVPGGLPSVCREPPSEGGTRTVQSALEATPVEGPTLRIYARVTQAGDVEIVDLVRGGGFGQIVMPGEDLGYVLVLYDASDQVRATLPAPVFWSDAYSSDYVGYIDAEVMATDVDRIEILQGTTVKAIRQRSANAPVPYDIFVQGVPLPSGGGEKLVLSGDESVTVRWMVQDIDGDEVAARVEYSIDDGQTFRPIASNLTVQPGLGAPQSISLPPHYFTATRSARIRVVVSDGFNELDVLSGRFKSKGAPAEVRIIEPDTDTAIIEGTTLYLAGEAYDGLGNQLPDRKLRWYDGKRRIGKGRTLDNQSARAR